MLKVVMYRCAVWFIEILFPIYNNKLYHWFKKLEAYLSKLNIRLGQKWQRVDNTLAYCGGEWIIQFLLYKPQRPIG